MKRKEKKEKTFSYEETAQILSKKTGLCIQDIKLVFSELEELLIKEIGAENKVNLNFASIELRKDKKNCLQAGLTVRPQRLFMEKIKNIALYGGRLIPEKMCEDEETQL